MSAKSTDYKYGTKVQLTAKPDTIWKFVKWKGDLTGHKNPAVITINSSKTVTSVFRLGFTTKVNTKTENGRYKVNFILTNTLPKKAKLFEVHLYTPGGRGVLSIRQTHVSDILQPNGGVAVFNIGFRTPISDETLDVFTIRWVFRYQGGTFSLRFTNFFNS